MKLLTYFDAFMKNTVNLNDSRLRDLDSRVEILYAALCAAESLASIILGKDPQGSWAHKTIIKPVNGREFDADFMLIMEEQSGWSPRDYINAVYSAFRQNSTYKDMVVKKNRCVRIVYANDCHIDIVPFVCLSDGRQVIANHETDEWEETDPDAFTAWMKQQDGTAEGNLRRVIRLMKYLRDHHMNFVRTRSVILTVLLGERIEAWKKSIDSGYYSDLPTAFVHILEDLDLWMDANPSLPPLPDPSGANNDFGHRWNQDSYDNLKSKVKTIAADARAALDADGTDQSLELWQKVFGSEFRKPPSTVSTNAGRSTAAAAPVIASVQSGRDG